MRPCLTLSVLNVFAWTGRVSSQLEKKSNVAGLGRKKEKHGANKVICKSLRYVPGLIRHTIDLCLGK